MSERSYTTEDGTEVIEWYSTPLEVFFESLLCGCWYIVVGLIGIVGSPLFTYWAWRDGGEVHGRSESGPGASRRRKVVPSPVEGGVE